MYNTIELIEKEEEKVLKAELIEKLDLFKTIFDDLKGLMPLKKDKEFLIEKLSNIFEIFDITKTTNSQIRILEDILENTDYIKENISGRVNAKLSDIRQKNFDNQEIRKKSEQDKMLIKKLQEQIKELEELKSKDKKEMGEAKEEKPYNTQCRPRIKIKNVLGKNPIECGYDYFGTIEVENRSFLERLKYLITNK